VEIAKLLLGEHDPKLYEFSAETDSETDSETVSGTDSERESDSESDSDSESESESENRVGEQSQNDQTRKRKFECVKA
jgi:hypothetical protein